MKSFPTVESSEHFSFSQLLHRCMGNETLANKMVSLFASSLEQEYQSIQTAVTRKNWIVVASLAHRLKGTAGTIGAGLLSQTAGQLEKSARLGDETEVNQILGELVDRINQLQSEIQGYCTT